VLSTLVAAVPIVVLLLMIGVLRKPAWMSALAGLGAALVIATVAYGMPADLAARSAGMPYATVAMTSPVPRPASADIQAGLRSTPIMISSTTIGTAATSVDKARLSAMGV